MAEEDDYLSDKFLADLASTRTSSAPKIYSQLRREAQKQSNVKNEKNRLKSRHQLELESRQQGLSKSLFERVKDETEAGIGQGSKALDIMMKMGFKPGQALGKLSDNSDIASLPDEPSADFKLDTPKHKTVPLPVNEEYKGKKGIGLGKRARSPTLAEREAKAVKLAESSGREAFRDRTRQVYEERRAEGRLRPSQLTCMTLDEKAGISFNVLWLDPNNPESFPSGLIDAMEEHLPTLQIPSLGEENQSFTIEARLRKQMQRDALRQLSPDLDDDNQSSRTTTIDDQYDLDTLREATRFIGLSAHDRLATILAYLRDRYAYCFWCGTQYSNQNEMAIQCPGEDEDAHD